MLRAQRNVQGTVLGTNHVALRAENERLVLALIRMHGSLSKAQLAELSGLAAQTASVISKSLIEAGLLVAGSPVRGKVGQPYVPLRLNPKGATFLGVSIDRSGARAAHVNFVGEVISQIDQPVPLQSAKQIVDFVNDMVTEIRSLSSDRLRFQGVGVSLARDTPLDGATSPDWAVLEAALVRASASLDISINVASDALAACSAELIYGLGASLPDFLYVFLDHSIRGGLVLNRRIRFSQDAEEANLGKMLIPNGKSKFSTLESLVISSEEDVEEINRVADGIALAIANCAAIINCKTVVVDGPLIDHKLRLVMARLRSAIARLESVDAATISAREGSMARKTAATSAASLPLLERYYPLE